MSQTKAQLIDNLVQPITGALGSASAPTFSFTADPNTGMYSPGADQLALSTGGTGRLFVDSSGRVGIGISPTTTLDVGGNLRLHNSTLATNRKFELRSTQGYSSFIQFTEDNIADRWSFGVANGDGSLIFKTGADFTGTERMRLTSTGALGLGSSSPAEVLHLGGSAAQNIRINGNTNAMYLGTVGDTTQVAVNRRPTDGTIPNSARGTAFINVNGLSTGGSIELATSTAANTGAVTAVTIDSSQRVGIGTTSPATSALLHVKSSGTYGNIVADNSSATGGGGFTSYQNGSQKAIFGTSGYIVGDTSSDAALFAETGGNIRFYTNGSTTERARIDSSGRLLVGTSSSVGGNVQIVGSGNGSGVPFLHLRGTNSVGSGGRDVAIDFSVVTDDTGPVYTTIGRIASFKENGTQGNEGGALTFSTTADGASSPTERMRINSSGTCTISNSSYLQPATDNAVYLGGGTNLRWIAVYAANGTIQTSDARQKTEIVTSSLGVDFVKSLRPVSYKFIVGGNKPTGETDSEGNWIYQEVPGKRTHWGFVAQEVKEAVDAAGVDFGGWILDDPSNPDSDQGLRYDQFIAPLTKALQEALAKIETLEAKVAALEVA
jgi:hypothetical protein